MKISVKAMLSVGSAAGAILVSGASTGYGQEPDDAARGAVMQATGRNEDGNQVKDTEKKEEKKEEEKDKKKDPCPACGLG